MDIFLAILGLACLVYYAAIVAYAGITADFAFIWAVAGIGLWGCMLAVRFGRSRPGFFPAWVRILAVALVAAGLLLFLILGSKVVQGMRAAGSENLDYVVVLGAQVKGKTPSRALRKRLDKALEYAQENPDTVLVLSGGQGSGEDITEAQCMADYLSAKGIPADRMVLEESSTTTRENLIFSDRLTGCAQKRTGILSNNFHVYRAIRLAEKQGYTQAEGIAAPSDPLMQAHYVVREVFALVKEQLCGNI